MTMFIPVCEARWYHGAAPSFGMGLLCVLEEENDEATRFNDATVQRW